MKNLIIGILLIVLIGIGIYYLAPNSTTVVTDDTTPAETVATSTPATANKESTVIGKSVLEHEITAYHFGDGNKEILLVGGIHGGYSWNTALVAFEAIDYLKANPRVIPDNVKVTVIPVLNPDGLEKVVGTDGRFTSANVPSSSAATIPGRFNAHTVDLNRNFDCNWQAVGTWQNKSVSGGTKAFSEPETMALKSYVEAYKPTAVLAWYSSAGGVYPSSCNSSVSLETNTLVKAFADASGYPAHESFDFYEVTGDMVNWLAKNNIPAISVLLTNHTDTEWSKNEKGIKALLNHYAD